MVEGLASGDVSLEDFTSWVRKHSKGRLVRRDCAVPT